MSPVAKKLQIKPNSHWLFINTPEDYLAYIEPLPDGVQTSFEITGPCDGVQLFARNSSELAAILEHIQPALTLNTIIWITFPKKNTAIPTDLETMSSWAEAGKYNLRPVASAAINQTWTALRFKPEEQVKLAAFRNSEIRNQNQFSEFIDVDKKTVTLPPEALEALQAAPAALGYFNDLAYSHKKEYVVWILEAKHEKTKLARLGKMVEMLLDKKKNPGEK